MTWRSFLVILLGALLSAGCSPASESATPAPSVVASPVGEASPNPPSASNNPSRDPSQASVDSARRGGKLVRVFRDPPTMDPHLTTDTASALRAIEIGADVLLMAKHGVDGIYDADPNEVPDAQRFQTLSYMEAISRRLEVMDSTALSLCMENELPIIVFDIDAENGIVKAVRGEQTGTYVSSAETKMAGV